MPTDAVIAAFLSEDLRIDSLTADRAADRTYAIERELRRSLPPSTRLALQRERARLVRAFS